MKRYWDERARLNAPWYVDTSLEYDDIDLDRFFETGRRIAAEAVVRVSVDAPHELAVEIGCGLGRVAIALADRYDKVIAVDVSAEMLARAQKHERVEYVLGDGSTLSGIEDASADLVVTFTVFQHIPSVRVIERYIEEAGRVLRPGGSFVFQWSNEPGALRWRARRALLGTMHRLGRRERYGRNAAQFLGSRVPMSRIRATLDRAGLRLEHTKGEGTLFAWAWATKI